jgi:PAS domain S-box-containing protein
MRGSRKSGADPAARPAAAQRFEHALRHLHAMLLEFDEIGRITYVSPSVTDVLGYLPEELRELRAAEWIHAEDVDQLLELARKLASTGGSAETVYRARHKQGRWLWLRSSASSFVSPEGAVRTLAFVHDVTEARQAGRALRITEDRFRTMAENAADLISEIDGTGTFVYVSPTCASLLGTPAEEYVGTSVLGPLVQDRLHADDRAAVNDEFIPRVASGKEGQIEYRYRHGDGGWRCFETRGRGYRTQGGELRVLLITRDVTERVRVHEALRASEERYRVLAESTHDLVVELDANGRVVYVSPKSLSLLGFAPGELVGTLPFALVHSDDVERVAEAFLTRVESFAPRRGGTRLRVRHRDGSWRWLEGGGVNYRTARGETRVVAVMRDVTEQQLAEEERRKLEEWLRQAQKIESLGLMASGIAHDFNNLLTPILGDASLALMDLPQGSPIRARLEKIQKTAQRAAMLTNQMLDYAGRGSVVAEPVDLSRLVGEVAELLVTTVGRKAELVRRLPQELPPIQADPAQLSQVVMNLITNAAEAIPTGGGRIVVSTGAVAATRAELEGMVLGEALAPGRYVYVEVEDSGVGMTPETRARIFDPFFTTKFTGRGLGLAAVLGIVRAHRGAIQIESQAGRGTRFRVLFPAAGQAARAAPERVAAAAPYARGQGTVLVADDDPGVLEVTSETLSRAGFDVVTASDGPAALARFREQADRIRVVLLDLQMPGASGEEIHAALRRLRPDARIILVSGYAQERVDARLAQAPDRTAFLQKPFLPSTLLERVRALLDA